MAKPKGRYYRVSPSFWIDNEWDDDTIIAALYLLTCPHRNTEGIFRFSLRVAAEDLRWTDRRFVKAFNKLRADGFIKYDEKARVCWIVNAMQWQAPANPNQVTAACKAIKELPKTPLLNDFRTVCRTLAPALADRLDLELPQSPSSPSVSRSFLVATPTENVAEVVDLSVTGEAA